MTDQVAKESESSTASNHPLHDTDKEKASIEHHQANPGPAIVQNMPAAESKEELKKRSHELNKQS